MARGWESKAVEAQLEATDVRAADARERFDDSPEMRARRERLESLRLSQARTLSQLERARSAAHRAMLERTLSALEREMSELV
ncbi:MAG TPA: hypothetical protein VGV59_13030 [Pyrinomonadaceae bacterium]|nr:hypothetical protein [Pyrinomonadaceae bacterium]